VKHVIDRGRYATGEGEMSHLYFNELNNAGKKTRKWEVTAIASDGVLGVVSFWGAWRKYVFMPHAGTLYDASCMREIGDFAEAETSKWRASVRPIPSSEGGRKL
jgi:hypothetical protein